MANNEPDDCSSGITSLGHNLAGDGSCGLGQPGDLPNTVPRLGALADNGGFAPTHGLLSGSPAIDAGDGAGCPTADQRGAPRPRGAACDIGAYEAGPPILTLSLNLASFRSGDTLSLSGGLIPDQTSGPVDVYLAIQAPSGDIFSLQRDGGFVTGPVPVVAGLVPIIPFAGEIFRGRLTADVQTGRYIWFGAITEAGTRRVVGDVAQQPFSVEP